METIKFENLEIFALFALAVVDYLSSRNAAYLKQHLNTYKEEGHRKADIYLALMGLRLGQSLTLCSITEKPRYKVTKVINPFMAPGSKPEGYAVEVID